MISQSIRKSFYLSVLVALILTSIPAWGKVTVNLGPLLRIEEGDDGSKNVDALGPFFSYKSKKDEREYGVRPLFYSYKDFKKDHTSFDFLYPISTHRTWKGDTKFQIAMYLFYYKSDLRASGFREREYTLFPIVFGRIAEDKERSFFAVFPLGGTIKQKYTKDEISFFLFPLFLRTEKDGSANNNILWPFIGVYSGNGVSGGRVWPLFGYRHKPDEFTDRFIAWPFYMYRYKDFYGESVTSKAFLPFYYRADSPGRKHRTVIWPFFNKVEDDIRGFTRYDVPWPFITISRGNIHTNRFFPIYSLRTDGTYEKGYLLWPFFAHSTLQFNDYVRTKRAILLFIYKDTIDTPTTERGKDTRSTHLWPLMSYRRMDNGEEYVRIISPLETFLSDNKPRERNWSPIWRIFEWHRYPDGREISSTLWNTIRTEKTKKGFKFDLRPIIPVITYENTEKVDKFYVLGGLFGYKKQDGKKILKFLFIPVTISSNDDSVVEEDKGDA